MLLVRFTINHIHRYLRKLPGNIVLGVQALATFLQTGKVSRSHHASAIPWRAGNREGSRNLLLNTRDEVLLLLVADERVRIGTAKSQLASLDILHTHSLPVEKITKTLGSVSLVDALTSALSTEVKHE